MNLGFRIAHVSDAALLASMNAVLIRAEGHRNPMSIRELESRMVAWLMADYRAVVFGLPEDAAAGYALFRQEPEFIYLRHLFVKPGHRRKGLGRAWRCCGRRSGIGQIG